VRNFDQDLVSHAPVEARLPPSLVSRTFEYGEFDAHFFRLQERIQRMSTAILLPLYGQAGRDSPQRRTRPMEANSQTATQ
jgi:hypothetical protein